MESRPYPYERWPRVDKLDARLLRAALRALPRGELRVEREAATLLGVAAQLRPLAAELVAVQTAKATILAASCLLLLEHAAGAQPAPLFCELPPELGAVLVDRVLGGDGRPSHPIGRPLDELSAGVLAYLAARLLAAGATDLRVRAVVHHRDQAASLLEGALGPARVLVWPFALQLGGEHLGLLRLLVPEASLRELARAPSTRAQTPAALRALPLCLCAHAARTSLRRDELAALRTGDVIVPERCRLARDASGWHGQLELHVVGSRRGVLVCDARGAELTIETGIHAGHEGGTSMTEAKRVQTQALELAPAEALGGDAPIELCLTLARFTLPLDELSALRPGEVLNTGRAIGEHAALTASGKVIAHGELVEVDGEIGLRITELASGA
jgi:type III secretion protein Q